MNPAFTTYRRRPCLALLGALGSLLCAGLPAQNSAAHPTTAVLQGTVRTPAGEPVAEAVVVVTSGAAVSSAETASSAETKTDAAGAFLFPSVVPGEYAVTAKKLGWNARPPISLKISQGENPPLTLILESQSAKSVATTSGAIEFDDKPNFTVAGLTDWNNVSIHGSDVSSRTSEALARETQALKAGSAEAVESKESDEHRVQGELDERKGDPLGAVQEYERATRLEPSERNYFAWGTELLLHRADQPAVEVFSKGSAAHPDSARLLAGWGTALSASGAYEEAARRLCQASELHPADATPYLFLGKIEKAATGPLPCGEAALGRFAHDQPGNAMANYYYAIALWKRERGGTLDGASKVEELLQKAVHLNPKFGEAYLQLGIVHAAQGHFERAIAEYKRALEVNAQLEEAHYRMGQVYLKTQDGVRAKRELDLYHQGQQREAAKVERQRREMRQFLIVLQEPAPAAAR